MKTFRIKGIMLCWLAVCLPLTAYSGSGNTTANAAASDNAFVATLSGSQETPPVNSTAIGIGVVVVDPATRVMNAAVKTNGITGTVAHIHEAPPGTPGPVVFPLTETPSGSGTWTTKATLTEAQFNKLKAGNYYFNVHSAAFPNGEIRGQIKPSSSRESGAENTGTGTSGSGS